MAATGILHLDWMKCDDGSWCRLGGVDLGGPRLNDLLGVYVIWTARGRAIYVGQGRIRERLQGHRGDPSILQYREGELWVTWASVAAQDMRDGIERYLADRLRPAVGSAYPRVFPLAVNLPR